MSQHFGPIGPMLQFDQARNHRMPSGSSENNGNCCCVRKFGRGVALLLIGFTGGWGRQLAAQTAPSAPTAAQATPSSFQGSVAAGEASSQPVDLTLDEAIQRGLKNNLGVILSATQSAATKGQRMSQLQSLLPSIDASFKEVLAQVDLAAQGIRFPGVPSVVGP